MTRFHVKFQLEGQSSPAEVDLQVDEIEISGDVVLRALGHHLHPAAMWPFEVSQADMAPPLSLNDRAVRHSRMQAARRYLRLTHITYRPEGRVLEMVL